MTEGRIDAGGARLRYVDEGAGEPALLLLHSGSASLEAWSAVTPSLGRAGRVVAIDRPGWGKSVRPSAWPKDAPGPSPFGPVGEVGIVKELTARLSLSKPILVGSSAGGTVALLAGLDHPELFSGLVLVSPGVYSGMGVGLAPGWLVPLMKSRRGRAAGARLVGNGFAKSFEKTMRRMFHDQARVTPEFLAQRRAEIGLDNIGATLWETAIASRPLGLASRLSGCRLPVLIVAGSNDRFTPLAENQRLTGELPAARLEVVPACGHLPHEENPEVFVDLVSAFRDAILGR